MWGAALLLLWGLLALNIILLEVFSFAQTIFIVTGAILLGGLVVFYLYYFYCYFKKHKKVLELQDEYVETLKPDKPLRFCPTDEELMKSYYESQMNDVSEREKKERSDDNSKTTNEEGVEEELEMS